MAGNNLAIKHLKRGLSTALSFSIERSLKLIEVGKVEAARLELEGALLYASSLNEDVADFVGLESIRPENREFPK